MKIKFLLFSVLLFTLLSTRANSQIISSDEIEIDYNNPKEYEIGGITIDGSDYLDKNVLIQSTDLIIGEEISVPGGKISKAVKNLWDLNLFSDVTIYVTKIIGKKIFLNIQLEERPRLSKFQISGIRKGLADDVREKIKLIRGKIVTENLVVNTKNRVSEFFIDKGYLDAEISITQKPDTTAQNQVILFINIKKNKKVRIKKINFWGNSLISNRKLKRYMKETKEYKWWNVFKQSKYLEENFEKDKEKILEKYNAKGFRDAKLISDTIYKVEKGYINLDIKLEEGPKYYFGDIIWVGNTKYSSVQLNAILGIKKGDVFNQSLLDQRLNMSQDSRDVSS